MPTPWHGGSWLLQARRWPLSPSAWGLSSPWARAGSAGSSPPIAASSAAPPPRAMPTPMAKTAWPRARHGAPMLCYLETPPCVWFAVGLLPLLWWTAGGARAVMALMLIAASVFLVWPSVDDTHWSRYQKLVGRVIALPGPAGTGAAAPAYLADLGRVLSSGGGSPPGGGRETRAQSLPALRPGLPPGAAQGSRADRGRRDRQ